MVSAVVGELNSVLEVLEGDIAHRLPNPIPHPQVTAFACVARSKALLESARLLLVAGRADCMNVLLRPLVEAWAIGVIWIRGDEGERLRIQQLERHERDRFGRANEIPLPDPEVPPRAWTAQQYIERASTLAASIGKPPKTLYDRDYRMLSLTGVHSIGAVARHLGEDPIPLKPAATRADLHELMQAILLALRVGVGRGDPRSVPGVRSRLRFL